MPCEPIFRHRPRVERRDVVCIVQLSISRQWSSNNNGGPSSSLAPHRKTSMAGSCANTGPFNTSGVFHRLSSTLDGEVWQYPLDECKVNPDLPRTREMSTDSSFRELLAANAAREISTPLLTSIRGIIIKPQAVQAPEPPATAVSDAPGVSRMRILLCRE
jgi:hypothetical protein